MFFNNILAVGVLATLVAGVPLNEHGHLHHHAKREVAWTTEVVEEFVTSVVTQTVYGAAPTPGSNLQHGPEFGPVGGRPRRTSHIFQTITVHPSPAPAPSVQSAPAVAPAPSQPAAPSAPAPAPSAPAPSQPAAGPAPAPDASAPAPAPSQPAPSQPAAPAPSSPPSSPGGGTFTGDITYYTPGLGACGITNTETDHIVAIAWQDFDAQANGANPNANGACGRSITINYNGQTAQATVEDRCGGCSSGDLDLTPSLFEIFAPLSEGRVSGVSWSYN